MYKKIAKNKKGFTLVELSLAIALIAILSIVVVLIISNSISAYHRGITLNQLNTVGMDLVDDMRMAVQESPARSVVQSCSSMYDASTEASAAVLQACTSDDGQSFVYMERYEKVKMGNTPEFEAPVFGVFCTGEYSYLWNSGYLNERSPATVNGLASDSFKLIYKVSGEAAEKTISGFKLLKIQDDNRLACKKAAGTESKKYYPSNSKEMNPEINLTGYSMSTEPIDVLEGAGGMAIYDLTAARPARSGNSNNMFYSISFILGTVQGGVNVMAAGDYCEAPEGENSSVENFDYCAINKFNFAAQAIGG